MFFWISSPPLELKPKGGEIQKKCKGETPPIKQMGKFLKELKEK